MRCKLFLNWAALFFFFIYPETFNDKPDVAGDVSADVAMAAKGDDGLEECGDELAEKGDSRLSLRMKLVTPVEEGSSERFSLQSKPAEHYSG